MTEKTKAVKTSPQGVPICQKCFWTVPAHSEHRCDVAAGKVAKRMIATLAVYSISGTMYGYGDHAVAFDIAEHVVVFNIGQGGYPLDLRHVFMSGLSDDKTINLVRAMVEALR